MQVNQHHTRSRAGWSDAENDRLFALAAEAAEQGRPLKSVFDDFAGSSGRRPNSVRNYYYARIKKGGAEFCHTPAFVPFAEEESKKLVGEVLRAQARGESVRACTLRLGNGDDRAMLRYQNKYRSLLRTNQQLVQNVMRELSEKGEAYVDPYAPRTGKRRAGRPKKQQNLTETVGAVVGELLLVEGLDVNALMEGLGTLALSAINGAKAQRALRSAQESPGTAKPEGGEPETLRLETSLLRGKLAEQHDRYLTLLSYFRQLVRVNTEFLKMNSVVKVSNLSSYIRDLETNVKTCQELMHEHASS